MATVCLLLGAEVPSIAQEEEAFPPSPLELTEFDPLIPEAVWRGEAQLTANQRRELRADLAELNRRAAAALAAGNVTEAFELWNREIRLSRFLGASVELAALLRVGQTAWDQQDFYQAQIITERLREIQGEQLEGTETSDLAVLTQLAQSYESVGARMAAIELYQQILEVARSQNDAIAEEETLRKIAQVAMQDLNYEEAAAAYRELQELAAARGDRTSEIYYVTELAYIYDRLQAYEEAIAAKRILENYYRSLNDIAQVTALKIAIGQDLAALGQLNAAVAEYQTAYRLAWEALQFYRAQEALTALAQLYEQYDQFEAALQVYRTQIDVHQLARNRYGLMMTYDRMGKVYQRQGNYRAALQAFQQGLALAQELGNRAAYFQISIDEVTREISRPRS